MWVLKVKVISLPYIFQVLYVLCFTRPRYQVSVYRTIGPLVSDLWFKLLQYIKYHYTPCKLCLWKSILFSRPSIRTNVRPCVRNVLFPYYLEESLMDFIKFCKHIHMYKANISNKKLRARGQYYWSYFTL